MAQNIQKCRYLAVAGGCFAKDKDGEGKYNDSFYNRKICGLV